MQILTTEALIFEYIKQPPLNHKLLLLTKDNVLVLGPWKGEPIGDNRTYKGWAPLPKRDKELESKMGYR